MNIQKPKKRALTQNFVTIEPLTWDAHEWMQKHAPEFGALSESKIFAKQWDLYVYRGYKREEVARYLIELWDSQQWPEEIGEEVEAQK